jgi:hypothetical protein
MADAGFQKQLYGILELSKHYPPAYGLASLAITLLNGARLTFGGKDFSYIRIRDADLRNSIFVNTNLEKADLSGVNFSNSLFNYVNLNNSNMGAVQLGKFNSINLGKFDGMSGIVIEDIHFWDDCTIMLKIYDPKKQVSFRASYHFDNDHLVEFPLSDEERAENTFLDASPDNKHLITASVAVQTHGKDTLDSPEGLKSIHNLPSLRIFENCNLNLCKNYAQCVPNILVKEVLGYSSHLLSQSPRKMSEISSYSHKTGSIALLNNTCKRIHLLSVDTGMAVNHCSLGKRSVLTGIIQRIEISPKAKFIAIIDDKFNIAIADVNAKKFMYEKIELPQDNIGKLKARTGGNPAKAQEELVAVDLCWSDETLGVLKMYEKYEELFTVKPGTLDVMSRTDLSGSVVKYRTLVNSKNCTLTQN